MQAHQGAFGPESGPTGPSQACSPPGPPDSRLTGTLAGWVHIPCGRTGARDHADRETGSWAARRPRRAGANVPAPASACLSRGVLPRFVRQFTKHFHSDLLCPQCSEGGWTGTVLTLQPGNQSCQKSGWLLRARSSSVAEPRQALGLSGFSLRVLSHHQHQMTLHEQTAPVPSPSGLSTE